MYLKLAFEPNIHCISNSLTCSLHFKFTYAFNVSRIYLLIQCTTYLKFSSLSNVSKNNVQTQNISISLHCWTKYAKLQIYFLANCISNNFYVHCISVLLTNSIITIDLQPQYISLSNQMRQHIKVWYRIVEQRRLMQACAFAQACMSLHCSHT